MAGALTISTLNDSSGVLSVRNGMTGIAKAWVNYNIGSQLINNSFNVSSVTYNATGNFTVNFATSMPNANYVPCGIVRKDNDSNDAAVFLKLNNSSTQSVSQCNLLQTYQTTGGGGLFNSSNAYVVFFGS